VGRAGRLVYRRDPPAYGEIGIHLAAAWNRRRKAVKPLCSRSLEIIARQDKAIFDPAYREYPVPMRWFRIGGDICFGAADSRDRPAAAGEVTVFDNSPAQLKQDQLVAERESLSLRIVEGDAADLSVFAGRSFDLVFNPCSTVFMSDVRAVWKECSRVLRPGGILMTGSMNPVHYIFDLTKQMRVLQAHSIPYSDLTSIQRNIWMSSSKELAGICHSPQICWVNLMPVCITDMYEDYMLDSALHKYHPSYIATRALKK
jgi:SAM-dependent methyltransferase